jgi:hypothetical protein
MFARHGISQHPAVHRVMSLAGTVRARWDLHFIDAARSVSQPKSKLHKLRQAMSATESLLRCSQMSGLWSVTTMKRQAPSSSTSDMGGTLPGEFLLADCMDSLQRVCTCAPRKQRPSHLEEGATTLEA